MKLQAKRQSSWLWLLPGALGFIFSVGLLAPDSAQACHTKFGQALKRAPVLTGGETMTGGAITQSAANKITIEATDEDVQVCPSGAATKMWTLGGNFAPPTIRRDTRPGTSPSTPPTELEFINKLGDGPGEIGHDDGNGVSGAQGLAGGTQTGVAGDHTEIGIHHHGSHVAPIGDGGACWYFIERDAVNPANSSRTYTYHLREVDSANDTQGERGVSEWYHNHRVDVTGHTAWKGLAGGMFNIDDPADPRVSVPGGSTDPTGGNSSTSAGVIPRGPAISGPETYTGGGLVNKGYKFDVSLVIRDLDFDANNQAPYIFDGQGSVGDHILVNGVPQPKFEVQMRKYLFRVLVPGNSRKYFMRLVDEAEAGGGGGGGGRRAGGGGGPMLFDMIQVQSDGGFMPNAVTRTEVPIGIAERVAIVIDFSQFTVGTSLVLENNDSAGGQCVPHSCSAATSEIMRFDVVANVPADGPDATVVNGTALRDVPNNVPTSPFYIGNVTGKNRAFRFTSEGQPFWTMVREDTDDIDGDRTDRIMDCRRYDVDPFVNTVEKWTLHGVGNWTHSIHIHDVDQICVSINGSTTGSGCETFNLFKETWPMAPGVTFEVKIKPTDFTQQSAENNSAVGDPSDPSDPCRSLSGFAGTSGNCSENIFDVGRDIDTVPVHEPFYHGDTATPSISSGVAPDNPANAIDGEAAGGRYMFHCHVLEHEDTGMMTHWRVRSGTPANPTNVRRDDPCDPPGSCGSEAGSG